MNRNETSSYFLWIYLECNLCLVFNASCAVIALAAIKITNKIMTNYVGGKFSVTEIRYIWFATCYQCKQNNIHISSSFFSCSFKLTLKTKNGFLYPCVMNWNRMIEKCSYFRLIKNSILNIEVPLDLMTCLLLPERWLLVRIYAESSTLWCFQCNSGLSIFSP